VAEVNKATQMEDYKRVRFPRKRHLGRLLRKYGLLRKAAVIAKALASSGSPYDGLPN
jgi:hypothetical protein